MRSRSQAITGIEPCLFLRLVAIVCDRVRSFVNKVLRSSDRNVSLNAMVSQRAALQAARYHDNHLSITFYTCVSFGKMEGEIDTEQFMEEIRKYDCLFNRFSKEFKDKFKKINAWSKVGEVFSISPAAAEKKFRNVRTAYGR